MFSLLTEGVLWAQSSFLKVDQAEAEGQGKRPSNAQTASELSKMWCSVGLFPSLRPNHLMMFAGAREGG